MFTKILPLLFLLLGAGGGIGAGLFLSPAAQPSSEIAEQAANDTHTTKNEGHSSQADSHAGVPDPSATEFVKMSNQFVIPVVKNDKIVALVVVSLSLETRLGVSEEIYAREPKLRDAFLRVLFDHANMGGFHGAFTRAETMDLLRTALRQVAQKEMGPNVTDVLIVDIIRQDT